VQVLEQVSDVRGAEAGPLPEHPGGSAGDDQLDGWSALYSEAADEREAFEQRLRLCWENKDDYDPLLAEIAAARDAMLAAEARMQVLIAYGREFTRPRPYRLEDLARAAGMSISGVRTAYDDDEVAEVARLTGARPGPPPHGSPVTGGPAPGCTRDPAWPSLVVHAVTGDVAVEQLTSTQLGLVERGWSSLRSPKFLPVDQDEEHLHRPSLLARARH
jgi:hypothetical protein